MAAVTGCSGAVHHHTRTGRIVRYVCGRGKFCCPTQAPSLYLEDEYLAEAQASAALRSFSSLFGASSN